MERDLKPHEILADPHSGVCICPESDCQWHGNCRDCVRLHRYHATLPNCLEIELMRQKGIDVAYIKEGEPCP